MNRFKRDRIGDIFDTELERAGSSNSQPYLEMNNWNNANTRPPLTTSISIDEGLNQRPIHRTLRRTISLQKYALHTMKHMPSRLYVDYANVHVRGTVDQVDNITKQLQEDEDLMEDNPLAEQLRRQTLRDMPQSLTVKRGVKANLQQHVGSMPRTRGKPLSLYKRLKYRMTMAMTKVNMGMRNMLYTMELWYSDLKTIEGHFGSGVATYFKFLRWLFLLNVVTCLVIVGFIVVPQILYANFENIKTAEKIALNDTTLESKSEFWEDMKLRDTPYMERDPFLAIDFFTGEGSLTNTTLFYGYYSNDFVHLLKNNYYSIPYSYFFTMIIMYVTAFILLSVSMARSYRRSFIETAGGVSNVFANKIFCGWDFGIATECAADLKTKSIFNELLELLVEFEARTQKVPILRRFWLFSVRMSAHVITITLLGGFSYGTWSLLREHKNTFGGPSVLLMSYVVNIVLLLMPILFNWMIKYEDYKSPRTSVNVGLVRTFLLEVVVVGVLLGFWLTNNDMECWESSLGQDIYRLILSDFFIAVLGAAVIEITRYILAKTIWPSLGEPELDIPQSALELVYNQTLFWVGLMFAPLISIVVVVKMFLTFYIKRLCLIKFCQPPVRPWRAAQTQTLFLVFTFLSLLGVVITHGYIMTQVQTSNCGPFKDHDFIYQLLVEGVLSLKEGNSFWSLLMSLTRPAVLAGILLAMCVCVYYLRAKARARMAMVEILKEMLVMEGKDKDFLLKQISRVSQGDWMKHMDNRDSYNEIPYQNDRASRF